jgi:hypothetical protein
LREVLIDFFRVRGGAWAVRVQLCTDLNDTPVEDAAERLGEKRGSYLSVARLSATPQVA